ncbi:MAG: hypothetical protein AVDCRST_MAG61-2880, partial [uncultured Friedmanniella sp.]
ERTLGGVAGGGGGELPHQAGRDVAAGLGAEPPSRAAGGRLPAAGHAGGAGGRGALRRRRALRRGLADAGRGGGRGSGAAAPSRLPGGVPDRHRRDRRPPPAHRRV